MRCSICAQEKREPTKDSHHLERSPVDPHLCLGCWIATVEMEKFLLRATGRVFWSLPVHWALKELLSKARSDELDVKAS